MSTTIMALSAGNTQIEIRDRRVQQDSQAPTEEDSSKACGLRLALTSQDLRGPGWASAGSARFSGGAAGWRAARALQGSIRMTGMHPLVRLAAGGVRLEGATMKILCAVDFTARAQAAAQVGAGLARRTRGSLELVHVLRAPLNDLQALATDAVQLDEEVRAQAHLRLADLGKKIEREAGVPVAVHLMEGDVEWSLLARARAIGADLIAMGAHGRPRFERFILGSVAERMVRISDRPVLVVPPGVDELAEGSAADGDLNVMVALDGRAASEGTVPFVRALRERTPCDVTFFRLYWPIEEYRRLGLRGARDLFAPDPEVVGDLERAQRLGVGAMPGGGQVTHAIEPTWGEPSSRILEAAKDRACDLLVMGAESRHGLARLAHPPVTDRVTRHAHGLPVVFVPAPAPSDALADVPRIFTVLVATDLSAAGNKAVPYGYALVAAHGGVVELCHVHERSLPDPPYAYDRDEGRLPEAERARLEAALRTQVPADADRLGITTRVIIVDGGKAATAIVQAAERLAVDVIVVGGSGAHAVLRGTHRPVLVVAGP
jgi:nucleotide-binding universal stress UspA family protein